uniref:MKRN2 opposite strand protein-like C-terminal domain-containing protein n=1 Tax=Pristionchus pacificus TaxID=54126 RepID=A0A2A6B849_PRIPA|eukprot:PDM62044.1 hypothetical protein PRIPAC_51486 [Pristionchus pacificus]
MCSQKLFIRYFSLIFSPILCMKCALMQLSSVSHFSCGARFLVASSFDSGSQECPSCHAVVDRSDVSIEKLPTPFGHQLSSAILLKPSDGSWNTFELGDDLHIGIAGTCGVVHSFWTEGIVSESTSWEDSIVVSSLDLPDIDARFVEFIDLQGPNFLPETYDETAWNCFDLIVRFLHFVNRSPLLTKVDFTSQFVEEPLKRAVKYLKLYREVENRGCVVLQRKTRLNRDYRNRQMADSLEDLSAETCVDRTNDANGFLNNQFDIFVHDYRELTEVEPDDCCGGKKEGVEDVGCSHSASGDGGPSKKEVINVTRKLQKSIFSLQSLPDATAYADLQAELKGLHTILTRALSSTSAEFAPSNLPLPDYDEADMQMLLGEDEVPKTVSMLEKVAEEKTKAGERLQGLLVQAEILMREATHAKGGIAK